MSKIEELEQKGFRIGIRPQKMYGTWYWVAGVNIGDDDKAVWIDSNNDLPKACYMSYPDALNASIDYCENYKPTKGSKRH